MKTSKSYSFYPWVVWALAASFFLFEYVTRVAPSVMANQLMQEFHVYALGLGALSAFFYYPYIAMQVPVGMLVDRFGPRRLLTVMVLMCALSNFIFGIAHNIWMADLGRFLMGFSSAFAFVSCLKLATSWFHPIRFPLLAGITQALGMVGASMGEGPMSVLVAHTSWRMAMMISASIFFVIGILIAIFVRDKPATHTIDAYASSTSTEDTHSMWLGLLEVFKNPKTWTIAGYAGFIYASSAGFGELWGVTYLQHVFHLSNHVAAMAIGLIFIGWAVGGPIMGWIAGFLNRRFLMVFSAAMGCLTFCILIFANNLSPAFLFTMMFIYGLTNSGLIIAYALAGHINGHRLAGTSIAVSNMASVIVGAILQPVLGWLIDLSWDGKMSGGSPLYTAHDFRTAMIVFPICFLIAGCFAFFSKKTIQTKLTG